MTLSRSNILIGTAAALLATTSLVIASNTSREAQVQDTPKQASQHTQSIVLGSGCFWGAEKGYEALPGVVDAVSGYADGRGLEPTYKTITQFKHRMNPDNFAEVVKVTYNTQMLSTDALLKHFFEHHDPTQKNRQGNDIGTQYRSTILYSNEEQGQAAQRLKGQFQELLSKAGYGEIKTTIKPLQQFHPAETYHQDYIKKNPNGYCPDHSTGVTFEKSQQPSVDNSALLKGQHILVLEAEHCPYCEQFRQDVANDYQGSIPMSFRKANELEGLKLATPTWATPTLYFLEDGKEQAGHQGYMSPEAFYKTLKQFKNGSSAQ
ncbi:peptide methionine sulfoxide reductase MsrA/MsrB [gamma proteobacterium HTCC5015]|nr:peptide methionine sulfoxide reductase MsrA/MsrB [gamma proteobacterium HTCC5015]